MNIYKGISVALLLVILGIGAKHVVIYRHEEIKQLKKDAKSLTLLIHKHCKNVLNDELIRLGNLKTKEEKSMALLYSAKKCRQFMPEHIKYMVDEVEKND